MKQSASHRRILYCVRSALSAAVICLTVPSAHTQSTERPTVGAAINSTPGTMRVPAPEDQLGDTGGVKPGQQASIDKMFIRKQMQDGLAEIQLGQLTQQKSTNPQVRKLAQNMIDDHTSLNQQMKPVAEYLKLDVPVEVSKKDKASFSKLQSLSGPAYDQAYIRDIVKRQKQDLNESRLEATNAHDTSVAIAALQASKKIAEHLQMAQQLAREESIDLAKE